MIRSWWVNDYRASALFHSIIYIAKFESIALEELRISQKLGTNTAGQSIIIRRRQEQTFGRLYTAMITNFTNTWRVLLKYATFGKFYYNTLHSASFHNTLGEDEEKGATWQMDRDDGVLTVKHSWVGTDPVYNVTRYMMMMSECHFWFICLIIVWK